jgi:hypothetical protein
VLECIRDTQRSAVVWISCGVLLIFACRVAVAAENKQRMEAAQKGSTFFFFIIVLVSLITSALKLHSVLECINTA